MLPKALQLSIVCLLLFQNAVFGKRTAKKIPGGFLEEDTDIIIRGKVEGRPKAIVVNLKEKKKEGVGDIGLHVSLRYDYTDALFVTQEDTIVLNTMVNGSYQEEERHKLHLRTAEEFSKVYTIIITPEEDHFKIVINGKSVFTFAYRTDISKLKYVEVTGYNVAYDDITFQE